jgi:hypothetical protein
MAGSSTYPRAPEVGVEPALPRRRRWSWQRRLSRRREGREVARLRLAERELARLRQAGYRPGEVDAAFLRIPPVRPRA